MPGVETSCTVRVWTASVRCALVSQHLDYPPRRGVNISEVTACVANAPVVKIIPGLIISNAIILGSIGEFRFCIRYSRLLSR